MKNGRVALAFEVDLIVCVCLCQSVSRLRTTETRGDPVSDVPRGMTQPDPLLDPL